ncbi:MAG: hypothetical protein IJN19_03975 [Opitutales bacterium]|nr:hypothetical protein [Opitutales bacterium]
MRFCTARTNTEIPPPPDKNFRLRAKHGACFIVPVRKIVFALAAMSTFSFPSPDSYGQDLSAQQNVPSVQNQTSANGELLNLITLADLTLYKNPRDVAQTAKRLLSKTDIITDDKLRTSVRLSLAEISAEPEKFPEIRARHFKKISSRFTDIADEARKNKNYKTALNSAQIATKADPRNLRARLILAALVDAYGGDTPTALKLMHAGLKFIDLDADVTPDYFAKYFEMLFSLQQDYVLSEQAKKILKNPNVPAKTRKLVALAGAFALYNRGQYDESLDIIARERLDDQQHGNADAVHGRILKARNLFASGKRSEAVSLLDSSISQFPAEKRELIYNQLSRFFSESNNFEGVLDVASRQIEENPATLAPRLSRLFAYKKLGKAAEFDAELTAIFELFSTSQSALVALANFAAEQGMPELALRCMDTARTHHFEAPLFVAAAVESLVAANRPADAIDAYVQATSADPKVFEEFQSVISAVLASAYAEAAKAESDPEKAEPLRAHCELLLGQFLENPSARPENQLAVIRHFRRIGRDDIANRVATAALKKFPWHSQIRADWLSLQLATPESLARLNVPAEIRTLAGMRRPEAKIWREVLAWLDSAGTTTASDGGWGAPLNACTLSPAERAELRALVAPLSQ